MQYNPDDFGNALIECHDRKAKGLTLHLATIARSHVVPRRTLFWTPMSVLQH